MEVVVDFKVLVILISSLLTSFVAISIAWFSLRHQKKTTRRQATIEHMMNFQLDSRILECSEIFRNVREENLFERILTPASKEDRHSRWAVLTYLNYYELMLIGVNEGVFDEKVLCLNFKSIMIKHWIESKEFICKLRIESKSPTAYCEYQKYSERWIRH
jgi:hypothetical protein